MLDNAANGKFYHPGIDSLAGVGRLTMPGMAEWLLRQPVLRGTTVELHVISCPVLRAGARTSNGDALVAYINAQRRDSKRRTRYAVR